MGGLADVFMERGDDFQFLANGATFNRFTLNLATGEASRAVSAWFYSGRVSRLESTLHRA